MPIEINVPRIVPIIIINIFLGFTGSGSVTASSTMRTFPIALDFAMLSSCCRFNNCK